MSITVHIEENQSVQVTDQIVEAEPPTRIAFAAEGTVTMTEELLGEFAGSSLRPIEIELTIDESRTIEIGLSDETSLRLDTVDVGVETVDPDDLSPGMDPIRSSDDDSADGDAESTDSRPGAIAFTVEGAIVGVPEESFDPVAEASPKLTAITFAVENSLMSDGGDGPDVIFEIDILGYGITVHRDGTIDVETGGSLTDIGLP